MEVRCAQRDGQTDLVGPGVCVGGHRVALREARRVGRPALGCCVAIRVFSERDCRADLGGGFPTAVPWGSDGRGKAPEGRPRKAGRGKWD